MKTFQISRIVLAALLALGIDAVHAQAFPSKPIRMIVPFAPGGGTDISARTIAPRMAESLGQPVLVENRPGNSSHTGTHAVVQSAPDGYTMLLTAVGTVATSPHLQKLDYDPLKDLTPLAYIGTAALGIAVNQALPVKSLAELVRFAGQSPKGLFYSVSALGTLPHLAGELFKIAARIEWNHVVYKGAGPAASAVAAGEVPASLVDLSSLSPHAAAGRVRILAVTGSVRSQVAPQVPTVAEAGFPGYAADAWTGTYGPAGLPGPVVTRLHGEINRALELPDVKKSFLKTGTEPATMGQEEFRRFVVDENRKWGKVIRDGKIQIE